MISIRGDRIRDARERAGMTQSQLADLCGMALQQIHRYESGKSDASGTGLKAIAEQLHVTTDYLLGLTDDPHGYGALNLREDERDLLEAYTVGDSNTVIELLYERLAKLSKLRNKSNFREKNNDSGESVTTSP